jgi:hypothetical protein
LQADGLLWARTLELSRAGLEPIRMKGSFMAHQCWLKAVVGTCT